MKYLTGVAATLLAAGCSTPKILTAPSGMSITEVAHVATSGPDPMLSWIGGLSTIAGIVALVLTRGSMGLRAVVIGIGMVMLNQAIARYGDWLFLPTLAATGALSVAYAYITIRRMVRHRQERAT
tara:strand:- start:363 stop:737 length:375 start_codon:yes stop_codon:yes gene_type:complete